jgi:3-hydroxyacyl-[acyl-carrier-protein] dehydratase
VTQVPIDDIPVELGQLDYSKHVYDAAAIRAVNPHRGAMLMLDAIVYLDRERHIVVGYKDVLSSEFWVDGHFPNRPVLPGVLMCEAAAQLCNCYAVGEKFVPTDKLMGLGGLEECRFRGLVQPGERLVIAIQGLRVTSRMTKFAAKGYVHRQGQFEPAFEGIVIGVSIGRIEEVTRA